MPGEFSSHINSLLRDILSPSEMGSPVPSNATSSNSGILGSPIPMTPLSNVSSPSVESPPSQNYSDIIEKALDAVDAIGDEFEEHQSMDGNMISESMLENSFRSSVSKFNSDRDSGRDSPLRESQQSNSQYSNGISSPDGISKRSVRSSNVEERPLHAASTFIPRSASGAFDSTNSSTPIRSYPQSSSLSGDVLSSTIKRRSIVASPEPSVDSSVCDNFSLGDGDRFASASKFLNHSVSSPSMSNFDYLSTRNGELNAGPSFQANQSERNTNVYFTGSGKVVNSSPQLLNRSLHSPNSPYANDSVSSPFKRPEVVQTNSVQLPPSSTNETASFINSAPSSVNSSLQSITSPRHLGSLDASIHTHNILRGIRNVEKILNSSRSSDHRALDDSQSSLNSSLPPLQASFGRNEAAGNRPSQGSPFSVRKSTGNQSIMSLDNLNRTTDSASSRINHSQIVSPSSRRSRLRADVRDERQAVLNSTRNIGESIETATSTMEDANSSFASFATQDNHAAVYDSTTSSLNPFATAQVQLAAEVREIASQLPQLHVLPSESTSNSENHLSSHNTPSRSPVLGSINSVHSSDRLKTPSSHHLAYNSSPRQESGRLNEGQFTSSLSSPYLQRSVLDAASEFRRTYPVHYPSGHELSVLLSRSYTSSNPYLDPLYASSRGSSSYTDQSKKDSSAEQVGTLKDHLGRQTDVSIVARALDRLSGYSGTMETISPYLSSGTSGQIIGTQEWGSDVRELTASLCRLVGLPPGSDAGSFVRRMQLLTASAVGAAELSKTVADLSSLVSASFLDMENGKTLGTQQMLSLLSVLAKELQSLRELYYVDQIRNGH